MVSHLFFYQLVLIALVWLCVMLHWAWPSDPAPRARRHQSPHPHCQSAIVSLNPLRASPPSRTATPVSTAPPLARKLPHTPPPRIVPTRGRRRQVDTSTHFCPNPDCAYRGWVGWGNLRANGHPSGGPWRQLLCIVCRGYFLETLGTIFHGKRASVELIVRVIACLAEGMGIRGTARVFEVDPNTVLQWLVEAAEQLRAFSQHFLHDIRVHQVQLDELFALLSAVKAGEVSEAEAIDAPGAVAPVGLGRDGPREQAAAGHRRRAIAPSRWRNALSTTSRRSWPPTAPRCSSPMGSESI